MSRAGFFTGLFLLVVLSYVTDWTIRLIVTNAKLSGTKSYIGIMNRCFGSSGRAAVSFFQFSFAFGGTYACVAILCMDSFLIYHRDVRFWYYYWCVDIVSDPSGPYLVPLQEIRFRTLSASYFPTSLPSQSSRSSPIVDLSLCSAPLAFPTHYRCTGTSTNSPLRPASRFAGCLSLYAQSYSKVRSRRPSLRVTRPSASRSSSRVFFKPSVSLASRSYATTIRY
jgi:hypothetical protein